MRNFPTLQRIRYYTGQLLLAEDFELEQNYFLEKERLHNRLLHGAGIIAGLEASMNKSLMVIQSGCALDCVGNLICVPEAIQAQPPTGDDNPLHVVIQYRECETNPIPVIAEPCETGEDRVQPSRITETYQITYQSANPLQSHSRHLRGFRACGESHGVPLARLSRSRGRWSVDRRFVVPRMAFCQKPKRTNDAKGFGAEERF